MENSFRQKIKPISQRLRIDDFLRQGYVEINRLGERFYHQLVGAPDLSSTVILAGSGRSGTTWLGNIISASHNTQAVFEPLIPLWNATVRNPTGWDCSDPYFRQIYLRPGQENPGWASHLQDVLGGRFRNYWTDYDRTSYFPKRYLIKEIRMNMMLGYIYDHFKCKIVYLMRHPCAVVHSRLNLQTPWHANVKDILSQEDLVEDFLHEWVGDIEKEKDLLGAHAVWWAVENFVALHELSSRAHMRVYYESAVLHPGQVADEVLNWLNLDHSVHKTLQAASAYSRMTRSESVNIPKEDHFWEWRKKMSNVDQNRILTWVQKLGIPDYSHHVLPNSMCGVEIK